MICILSNQFVTQFVTRAPDPQKFARLKVVVTP